jgi:hypothetical protein
MIFLEKMQIIVMNNKVLLEPHKKKFDRKKNLQCTWEF